MKPAVECKKVSRIFRSGASEVFALNQVDFLLNKGEMTAVVGPSGSGKSTLLNMIGCLDSPTSGNVLVDGEDISSKSKFELSELRNHKIGFIFQSFHLIPVLTAYENVELALQIQNNTQKKERHDRITSVLEAMGIADLAHRKPGEISGGQQQRVAIARALVKKPLLILADEPTANLDSKTAHSIIDLMLKLNQEENTTFLLSTHDPRVMESVPRVVTLRDGKIVEDTKPSKI